MWPKLGFFVLAGVLASCAAVDATNTDDATDESDLRACAATSPRSKEVELFVWPEAGEAPLVDALKSAKKSIRLMVYMLGQDGIFDVLKERAAAGVDVRVILDGNAKRAFNTPAFDALAAAGVEVKWSDPKFAFMHAKSFVVDKKVAMIATGNFPKGFIADERNYVARDPDAADIRVLSAIFDADWNGTSPNVTCTRLLVSPINAKERLLDLIGSAKTSVLVESLALSDRDVIAAIIDRKRAGLDVRVLLADPMWDKSGNNAVTAKKLDARGIPTKMIPKSRMLVHVKSILVDGDRAYLGSENLTANSLTNNREVGLVLSDKPALQTMTTTFEGDFASAESL